MSSRLEELRTIKNEWDNLKTKLGEQPPTRVMAKNPYAGNSLYVPIGYVQAKLDQLFLSWDWHIERWEFVAGNCVVCGTLEVTTISGNKIVRAGIGVSEVKVTGVVVVKKAMEKGLPKADSQALKNAAQKIGNILGRSLNRDFKYGHISDTKLIDKIFGDE